MARWFVDRSHERGIPSVSLRRLLPGAQFVGAKDWDVSGCCDDHRRLEPGQLFVAVARGKHGYDGHNHVQDALNRGAAGVVAERFCEGAGRLQVVVTDARAAHARICQALSGDPSRQLTTLGVTGGYGKTITAVMIRSILEAGGDRFGLLGPAEFNDGNQSRLLGAGFNPTPARIAADRPNPRSLIADAQDPESGAFAPAKLSALLAELVDRGCIGAVIELSATALENRSFEGVTFDAALITNTLGTGASSPESLISRRRATARMFRQLVPGGLAVVNADDPNAEILGGLNLAARRVAFALEPISTAMVDISARFESLDGSGTRMLLHGFDRELRVHVPLLGVGAAKCALAAAALAWGLGIEGAAVVAGLESLPHVPGHLEPVLEGQNFEVRIDGARTPAALGEALAALRSVSSACIHCVMSCDGCVDRAIRRELAAAAEISADRVILTLGSPRTENPAEILSDVLGGFQKPARVLAVPDRRTAIETALSEARGGDAVLIAGKGRDSVQIFADRAVPFDDTAVAAQWLRNHRLFTLSRSA